MLVRSLVLNVHSGVRSLLIPESVIAESGDRDAYTSARKYVHLCTPGLRSPVLQNAGYRVSAKMVKIDHPRKFPALRLKSPQNKISYLLILHARAARPRPCSSPMAYTRLQHSMISLQVYELLFRSYNWSRVSG